MAATVIIERHTGAGPTATNITAAPNNVSVTLNDLPQLLSSASSAANPIPIPAAGVAYSFWCTTGLNVTVAPTTAINNIRWNTDGTNNLTSGVTIEVADQTLDRATEYEQAVTGGPNGGGQIMTTGITAVTTQSDAFSTYDSGSPLTVAGSIAATTGALGEFVVYQFKVSNTATPGPTGQETITWSFDET